MTDQYNVDEEKLKALQEKHGGKTTKATPKREAPEKVLQDNQGQPSYQQRTATGLPQFGIASRLAQRGSGGDAFEEIYRRAEEVAKYVNDTKEYNTKIVVSKLLRSREGLNYSGIVISQVEKTMVASYVLMIEATGSDPEAIVDTVNNKRFTIIRTPSDALDEDYVACARDVVAHQVGVDPNLIVIADGYLVPREFEVTNEDAVTALLDNALNAVQVEVNYRSGAYKGLSIPELIKQNPKGTFTIDLHFNRTGDDHLDFAGTPIRQDICVQLRYKTNHQSGNYRAQINQGNDSMDIAKVFGYVDFEFQRSQVPGFSYGKVRFIPNFIITRIETSEYVAPTPDMVILAMASVLTLNNQLTWLQAFQRTTGKTKKGDVDLREIGALNIEANVGNLPTMFGELINTKAKDFTPAMLYQFVSDAIEPEIMVSVDIPKAGPETWFLSVFKHIASSVNARNRVLNSLSVLVGQDLTGYQGEIVNQTISNTLQGGYYRTPEGNRDLRHLTSYLSVANWTSAHAQSTEYLTNYTQTLYDISVPSDLRASARASIIGDMNGNSSVYKQTFERVTIGAEFLNMVNSTLYNAGFVPMLNNDNRGTDVFAQRAQYTAGDKTVLRGTHFGLGGAGYGTHHRYTNNYSRMF